MTLEEAEGVAGIVATADGGCWNCVGGLVARLNRTFPAFRWSVDVDERLDTVVVVEPVRP